jgi:16S rRNA (guanine527-N7)-methyltransferase
MTPSAPVVPAVAREHFAEHLPALERYAAVLADTAVVRGLIGPREVERLWERHLLNCAVVASGIRPARRVADVGSGAGLPGLVLAILLPDVELTLLEPMLRRAGFLEEAIGELGLTNVRVRRERAEQCPDLRGSFDVVTARAVAPLDRLAAWVLPLVAPGGRLLALKGAGAAEQVAAARPLLDRSGVARVVVRGYGLGIVDPPTTVVEVTTRPGRRATGGRSRTDDV